MCQTFAFLHPAFFLQNLSGTVQSPPMKYPPLQRINAKPARPSLSIFIRGCSAQRTALSADCSRQSPVNVLTVRGRAGATAGSSADRELRRGHGARRNAARETSGWDLKWCHGRELLLVTG